MRYPFCFLSHLSNFVPRLGRKKTAAANLSVYQSKTEKFIAAAAIRKCFQSTLYSYSILISAALSMDFSCIARQYLFYKNLSRAAPHLRRFANPA